MRENGRNFNTEILDIGDSSDEEDRLPYVSVELCRCHDDTDKKNTGWRRVQLTIVSNGVTITLDGLNSDDLRRLSGFLDEYSKRLDE